MYKFLGIHYSRWAWLLSPFDFFIRIRSYPNSIDESFFKKFEGKDIIYVLPRMSILDIMVLNKALRKLKQKKIRSEARPKKFRASALLALKPRTAFFHNEQKEGFTFDTLNLLRQDPRVNQNRILLLPVSIFWSRAAEKEEKGVLIRALFPDDGSGNGLQKLITCLLHRGEVNAFFGKTFSLTAPSLEGIENDNEKILEAQYHAVLKVKRLINIEFAKERTAAFGPALYDKDKITQWVLSSGSSVDLIESSENKMKTKRQIVRYVYEIAANYNYVTVRALEKLFDFLWNNVFSGVRVRNFERIERLSKDGQVIWTPSHRSHFDYLLLSYVLLKKGLVTPHIAAGINLNFWPIGYILRLGGAFFIRRSFAGNKLYANTFSEYVNFLLQNSFPIEFFQEGGRSRTGKLLTPKLGMMSICVQSIISRKAENTFFIPVNFGYDKVMEDDTYARELKGTKKQKENALQFLNGVRKIFDNYGSVDVSFGEPLRVADIWQDYYEKLKKESETEEGFEISIPQDFNEIHNFKEHRDPRIQGFVHYLSKRINERINCAATASSTALLSCALLANKGASKLCESELKIQLILFYWFANEFGESLQWPIATNTVEPHVQEYLLQKIHGDHFLELNFAHIETLSHQYFKIGEKWKLIERSFISTENSAVTISKNGEKEFNLWWYRGTVFHVFAGFSIVAFYLLSSLTKNETEKISVSMLESKMSLVRSLWQEELYWDSKTSSKQIVSCVLSLFERLKLLNVEENLVTLINVDKAEKYLKFIVNFIHPEQELYGVQAATALDLMKQKGSFQRDELIQKSYHLHNKFFFLRKAHLQAIFSKIFANKVFDAFIQNKIYKTVENGKLVLDINRLNAVQDFLEISRYSKE
jgi:glycerol-3-phosphate O-acyltransferase